LFSHPTSLPVTHRQAIALHPDNARFHSALLLPQYYLAELTPQALSLIIRTAAPRPSSHP
jgi:hypothetical protein